MRPTRASPTSSESMTTNETSSAPATPVMRAEPTGREIAAPAAASTARPARSANAMTARVTWKSYRTAREPVHHHFRPAGHLVPLEPHPVDGRQEVAPGRDLRKPGRKDDDEVRAALGHEPEHARLPFPAVAPALP